jgi:RimJ/RimL family protein N-acetyltransferase
MRGGDMNRTAGVYMLLPKHAAALGEFADDPEIGPRLAMGAGAFVAAATAEREAGTAFAFTIEDRGSVVGICRLGGIGKGAARELDLWVAPAFRGKGYATLGVRMLLELAFKNLSLGEVRVRAADTAIARVLAGAGFAKDAAGHAITKERWRDALDAPALSKLHPALRRILDAERAAGNEIAETSIGWPEPGSVLVRMKHPFRAAHAVPEGIRFTEPDDPHWWKAEYASESPRQILAC